jgi:hypothetical protein
LRDPLVAAGIGFVIKDVQAGMAQMPEQLRQPL